MGIKRIGLDYDAEATAKRLQRLRTCSMCGETFTSVQKAKELKKIEHAY